uniref:Secreted protein n=1 Tax=Heligmosomoides polygyrus TaxID=6339 RepID=A0A183FBF3_HELPZ
LWEFSRTMSRSGSSKSGRERSTIDNVVVQCVGKSMRLLVTSSWRCFYDNRRSVLTARNSSGASANKATNVRVSLLRPSQVFEACLSLHSKTCSNDSYSQKLTKYFFRNTITKYPSPSSHCST